MTGVRLEQTGYAAMTHPVINPLQLKTKNEKTHSVLICCDLQGILASETQKQNPQDTKTYEIRVLISIRGYVQSNSGLVHKNDGGDY